MFKAAIHKEKTTTFIMGSRASKQKYYRSVFCSDKAEHFIST